MKQLSVRMIIFIMIFIFPTLVSGKEENLKEAVAANNVEILVRVFNNRKPVDNLTRENFKIYEDMKLRTINGFKKKRKRIGLQDTSPLLSRCFVLVFHLNEYSEQIHEGLTHFLNNILREKDQLLIIANDKTLFYNDLRDKEKIFPTIDRILREESKKNRERMVNELKENEKFMNKIRSRASKESVRDYISNYKSGIHLHYYMKYIKFSIEQYINALSEYKKKYLVPKIDEYYKISELIKKIKKEKWMINFLQIGVIPELKKSNRAFILKLVKDLDDSVLGDELLYSRLFKRLLDHIDDLFNDNTNIPVKEISKLFYKVDVTFNAILVSTDTGTLSKNKKYQGICTNIEESLGEVAHNTGGNFIISNNIKNALGAIKEKEDLYYLLTYISKNPKKTGKIGVEVNNKNYKVFYNDDYWKNYFNRYIKKEKSETPSIQLKDLSFNKNIFFMIITNFQMKKNQNGETGKIIVRIRIRNRQDYKIQFDQSNTMLPQKDVVTISLNFPRLKKGNYDFVVDASDLISRKACINTLQVAIK